MIINFVRAMSSGASKMPATPAADTATANEARGKGEERTSRPPAYVSADDNWVEIPGSGKAKIAERKDRANDVMVESIIE